jgi:hypothetical protein
MGEQKKGFRSVGDIQDEKKMKKLTEAIKETLTPNQDRTLAEKVRDTIPDIAPAEDDMAKAPIVFISYSYDSPEHEQWVEDLAKRLRADGIDVRLDKWHFKKGKPSGPEMNKAITEPDRVLCICTDKYIKRVEEQEGGAGYEGFLITAELVKDAGTDKFIPVIRNVKEEPKTPKCLDTRGRVDLSDGERYERQYESLLRDLHDAVEIPPLGKNPFAKGSAPVKKT